MDNNIEEKNKSTDASPVEEAPVIETTPPVEDVAPASNDIPAEKNPKNKKSKGLKIAIFVIAGAVIVALAGFFVIKFLPKKTEEISETTKTVQSMKTAISEAKSQTEAKEAAEEVIKNAEGKISKNELKLSSIYLYLLGGYPALANDELIDMYSKEKMSDEEKCKYYDLGYILAQNNANDFEVGYYHASRTEVCENVLKNYEKKESESDFRYAMRLQENNFFSFAFREFEELDFEKLTDKEKISAYENIADYYFAIGDIDNHYETLNKKIAIENPVSEEDFDGVRF